MGRAVTSPAQDRGPSQFHRINRAFTLRKREQEVFTLDIGMTLTGGTPGEATHDPFRPTGGGDDDTTHGRGLGRALQTTEGIMTLDLWLTGVVVEEATQEALCPQDVVTLVTGLVPQATARDPIVVDPSQEATHLGIPVCCRKTLVQTNVWGFSGSVFVQLSGTYARSLLAMGPLRSVLLSLMPR